MAAPRILVVDDEPAVVRAVCEALAERGMEVRGAGDGEEAGRLAAAFGPDLAVLDVMLPGADGFTLAARLREAAPVPVIFLTARDDLRSRLTGFDLGADDYVAKPFLVEELVARVIAVLRRAGRLSELCVRVGDLEVDEGAGAVRRAGRNVAVTATELRLLAYLARSRGRVLSKTQLLTQVWGYDQYDPNLVEVHVSALRRKLEAEGGERLIHTVRGLGYTLRAAGEG